ncbi:MAG: LamG-like jellyroll fold domain-containing protein [Gallionella sp.]
MLRKVLFAVFVALVAQAQSAHAFVLLGQYHLEEVWGNVLDSSGNNRHGTVSGTPPPNSLNSTPARLGTPGTCGYGNFSGGSGDLSIPALPVNLAAGAQTSVSFWMNWNGSNGVMPIGWGNNHDLWLVSGFLGFNSNNSDVYGISSAGLANSWHHVVAVFTNGSVTTNALYIDGVAQTLIQQQGLPNLANVSVATTLHVSGFGANAGYKFGGLIDEVKVFDGALLAADVTTLFNETHPCPVGITVKTSSVNGVGNFSYSGTNGLPATATTITTTLPSTPTTAVGLRNVPIAANNTATDITQVSTPAGFNLLSASCVDANNATIMGTSLFGNTLTLPAAATAPGANVTCTFINRLPPTLLAQYHLEEATWGAVTDSSGGNHTGSAVGAPLPMPSTATPARAASPGTCGYGSFAGGSGELTVAGLPVNLTANAQTSVSFWMNWNGTNNVMPIGWNVHDLWLVSGFFGFNTGNSDVYGMNSAGLVNGWHHVVAIFTNGNVINNSLYIDGVAQALAQKASIPNNSNASVNSTLHVSGWGPAGYKFTGLLDEVKVFDGALNASEVSALFNETHACAAATLIVTKTVAVLCDSVNGISNPKYIPGGLARWNISVANTGAIAANLTQTSDTLTSALSFDSNLVAPTSATSCSSTLGTPSNAAGKGFKLTLTGTTRPAANYPKFFTTSNADADGASHSLGNIVIDYPLAMPAELGYSAGDLRPGETATIIFDSTLN